VARSRAERAETCFNKGKAMSNLIQGGIVWLGLVAVTAVCISMAPANGNGAEKLQGKRVAILVTDGFEQVEMTEPRHALDKVGAKTVLVTPHSGDVKGWNKTDWGDKFPVDATLDQVRPQQFDALLLPGGVMNPDHLRMNEKAVAFVRAFHEAAKPIAAICHGPWTLIEADAVRGRTLTSWPSLKTDIRNAGGTWVDEEVAMDAGLVTSRKPADIPAFNRRMIEEFAVGGRAGDRGRKVA
jgi:protease I